MIDFDWDWINKDSFPCPLHTGKSIGINGLGPMKWSTFTKALKMLPTSDDFEQAGRVHDVLYSLLGLGLIYIKYNGTQYIIESKSAADALFYLMMQDVADQKPWYSKPIFKHAAKRNWLCVAKGGDDSVKHQHL